VAGIRAKTKRWWRAARTRQGRQDAGHAARRARSAARRRPAPPAQSQGAVRSPCI